MDQHPVGSPGRQPAAAPDSGWERLNTVAPGVALVVVTLAAMWAVEIVELLPPVDLNRFGVRPRTLRGLFGIVAAPFLHSGFGHLARNSVPFLLLGSIIAWHSRQRFVEVTVVTALVSGLGIWIFGRSGTVHIGASGVVFGFVGYLVTRGVFARKPTWIIVGVVVAVTYSGLIWGLLPTARVSWLGHLFGGIGGVLAAWMLHGQPDDDEPAATTATAPSGLTPR